MAWFHLCFLQHHLACPSRPLPPGPRPRVFRVSFKLSCAYNAWSRGSFFFHLLCLWASSDSTSSSTKRTDKSFDSSTMHTKLLKSSISDLKIFSITQLAGIGSPFRPSWLATFSTRVMYSVTALYLPSLGLQTLL